MDSRAQRQGYVGRHGFIGAQIVDHKGKVMWVDMVLLGKHEI